MDRTEKKIRRIAVNDYQRFMAITAPAAKISSWLTRQRKGIDWQGCSKADMAASFVAREYLALNEEVVVALESEFGTRLTRYSS